LIEAFHALREAVAQLPLPDSVARLTDWLSRKVKEIEKQERAKQ
jgi:hypothetical protein